MFRERLSSCAFCPYNVAVTASAVTLVGGARAELLPGHFSASFAAKGHSVMARVGPDRPTGGPPHRCMVTQGTCHGPASAMGAADVPTGLPGMHVLEYRNILLMYW